MPSKFPACCSTIAVLLAAIWSAGAVAGEGDLLSLNASAGYSYDSNVFRIGSDRKPTGQDHRDDSIWSAAVGVDLNKVIGRQRFYGNGSVTQSKYQDFDFLDNTGYQGTLGYRLGFGSDSEAGVYYSRSNLLNNYADLTGYYDRNMLSSDRYGGDILLRIAGDWVGVGSVTQGHDENSASDRQAGNSDIRAFDIGVRYAPRGSKNYIESRYRESSVDYERVGGATNFDYVQREVRLSGLWSPNQISSLETSAARVRSRHEDLQNSDFSGWSGYVGYIWRPTVASSTTLRLSRDVGAAGDAWGSYSRTNGLSLKQAWQTTSKLGFDANLAYQRRVFSGYQTISGAVVNGENERRDKIYTASVGGSYAFSEKLSTRLSLRNERRLSNVDVYSFTDTIAVLNAQYKF